MNSTSNVRLEKDSIGTVEIPEDACYGAQTARALANFRISGRTAHPNLIRAYLRLKRAAAVANRKCGVLGEKEEGLIVSTIDRLLGLSEYEWKDLFPVDPYQAGAGTCQNMNLNEVIANIANRSEGVSFGTYKPIHPNDHVNCSQSTNDGFPTAMRLALLEASNDLIEELKCLAESFERKGNAWKTVLKSSRTHLQDAVPMRLGSEIGAYGKAIARTAGWISSARLELLNLGVGGSASGTGLNVPPGFSDAVISELRRLTYENVQSSPDFYEAMQSQAPISNYSSSLRVAALELTRICNDLRLLASGPKTGLAELILPAVQPGSSIMAGKVNPSIVEMANQTFFAVLGYDQTIAYSVQAGQLELNVMMPIMAYATIEETLVMTHAVRALRLRCVDGLEPNEPKLKEYFESTPQIATALTPRLGYEVTAELVKESLKEGVSVLELVRNRKILSEEELQNLLGQKLLLGP